MESFNLAFLYAVVCIYFIYDIFMITYFGNEIKLSSDRLSYCLFESNWMDQSDSCKKLVFAFAELVKQPHELVIGKLYPLNLETFTRVIFILCKFGPGSTTVLFHYSS